MKNNSKSNNESITVFYFKLLLHNHETLTLILLCTILTLNMNIITRCINDSLNNTHTFQASLSISIKLMLAFVAGFHTIAFIISFIHWFLDTWTSQNAWIRKRFFNQAKGHHYYPTLVIEKDFFARNDDVIYGSLFFGIFLLAGHSYFGLYTKMYIYSLMISTYVALEIHRYAHMPAKDVPTPIKLLQRSGIILSKESHAKHHSGKYHNQSYDLMSTHMNTIMDYLEIYPKLEKIITKVTGLEPRTHIDDKSQREEFKEYYESHKK